MTGLNKITEKIISEANDRARVIIEQARKRCIEISNEYAERAETRKTVIREEAEKEANAIIAQSKSSVTTEKKNALLKAKRALVDETFEAARAEIDGLSEEKKREMIASLAAGALFEIIDTQNENLERYGEAPDCEEYELVLNKRDLDSCGEAVYEMLCLRVEKKYGADKRDKVYLSKKAANIDGGAIIRCGDLENNASFSKLFATLRDRLEYEIASYLFAEGKIK